MRAALGLILLVVLAPAAQAAVAVGNVKVPERTAAEHAFPVSLTLHNDGPERTVTLLAGLYAYGDTPCGPATDPRFRAFTHVTQERVRLPANGQVQFPQGGRPWLHRYGVDDVPSRPETMELCVFVAANEQPGPTIQYESYASVPLAVRQTNRPPSGDFTWSPATPTATDDVTFAATGQDPDGDPLTFRWDFGHANASGRAVSFGERVVHFFYPEGDYVVTLVVSDGLDEAPVEHGIHVRRALAAGEAPAIVVEQDARTPAAWWLPLAALALLSLRRRR